QTRALFAERNTSLSASAGVRQSSVLRGLVLSASATAARSVGLCMLRSVPFGRYCRSSPLVFSFVPRCHGLFGSQKKTGTRVAGVKSLCIASSAPPRSHVRDRKRPRGRDSTFRTRASTTLLESLPLHRGVLR